MEKAHPFISLRNINLYPEIKFNKSDLLYEIKPLDELGIQNTDF